LVFSKVCKHAVGCGELVEPHFAIAQGESHAVVLGFAGEGIESRPTQEVVHLGGSESVEDLHGGNVERFGKGLSGGDESAVVEVEIFRIVQAVIEGFVE
jgi:hypothetical protein